MIDASGRAQISAALSGGVDLSKISLRKSAIGEGARKNLYSERNGEPDHLQPTGECKLGWAGLGSVFSHPDGAAFADSADRQRH